MIKNKDLKNFIKEKYGTVANYCRIYGWDNKVFNSVLARDLPHSRLDILWKYFGPLNIDWTEYARTGRVKKYGGQRTDVHPAPCFTEGQPFEAYTIKEASAGFQVVRDGGRVIPCEWTDRVGDGEECVFLVRGAVRIGVYRRGESDQPDRIVFGREVLSIEGCAGVQVIGRVA